MIRYHTHQTEEHHGTRHRFHESAARPSHEAIEQDEVASEVGDSNQNRLDHIAMEAARRSSNRIIANEESLPSSTIFSK